MTAPIRRNYHRDARKLYPSQSRVHLQLLQGNGYPDKVQRPRTRAECCDGPRPCPWVSCQYHLYLDVSERTGSIKLNFPELDPSELEYSCALDEAERGGLNLVKVGKRMNFTRERARQVIDTIIEKLGGEVAMKRLREDLKE